MNTQKITLNGNDNIWKMSNELQEKGYKKTNDAFWVLVFENENGNKIIIERE